jgi:hypothetical protein
VAKSTGNLTVALSWCHIGLQQAERVRETFDRFRLTSSADVGRVGSEWRRLSSLYFGDVHFLVIATDHVIEALDGMPLTSQPAKPMRRQLKILRNQLEHWERAQERTGAWKALPEYGTPYQVMVVGSDLKIGADKVSLQELEGFLTRTRNELLEIVERTSDHDN